METLRKGQRETVSPPDWIDFSAAQVDAGIDRVRTELRTLREQIAHQKVMEERARAEAWQEGVDVALAWAIRQPDGTLTVARPNPYRSAPAENAPAPE